MILAIFPAVARQIHRGDVQPSELVVTRNVHVPSLFDAKLSFDDTVAQGYDDKELDSKQVSARSLAVARSVVAFTDQYTDTPAFDLKPYQRQGALASANEQLHWFEEAGGSGGFFTIDTPGTKAVVGFAAGRTCQLGEVTIEPQSRFGAVYVTAREPDETIASASQLLIVAIARARNTGMKFSPDGKRLLASGQPPVLMEPVKATIAINRPKQARVIVLDQDGVPTKQTLPVVDGRFVIDGAKEKTPYYLVVFD